MVRSTGDKGLEQTMAVRSQRYQVPIYGSPGHAPVGGIPVAAQYGVPPAAYPPQYTQKV